MPRVVIGLGGSDHDFAAALMRDRDIRVAIEQERLSRSKHGVVSWFVDPLKLPIEYCLKAESLTLDDVESFVSSDLLPQRSRFDFRDRQLHLYPHHLCHAASAYMMLPTRSRAAVLVYDGFGSVDGTPVDNDTLRSRRETFSFFIFGPDGHRTLGQTFGLGFNEQDDFPVGVTNSIGMLYELVTVALGYGEMDSGKTMGLAAHGSPRYQAMLEQFVKYGDSPSECFSCATDDPELALAVERVLASGRNEFAVRADLAASVQAVVNATLLHCSKFFAGQSVDALCVSGGCALNTVANSFLVEHSTLAVPICIPPHCGDAGVAFGALWLERLGTDGAATDLTFRGRPVSPGLARPGRCYQREECRRAAQDFYPRLASDASVLSPADLAKQLAAGAVVGVVNGGSEIGPRALGGRSILANPCSAATRERVNRFLKKREPFRPLGPLVLRSFYDDYFFDPRQADPFMLKVSRVRERCLREAPAVVHVDGTARVQVVDDGDDPFLVELLHAFHKETGTPILLNTSFNRRGEPIVETPSDAFDAFLGMGLDGLYVGGEFYRAADRARPSC